MITRYWQFVKRYSTMTQQSNRRNYLTAAFQAAAMIVWDNNFDRKITIASNSIVFFRFNKDDLLNLKSLLFTSYKNSLSANVLHFTYTHVLLSLFVLNITKMHIYLYVWYAGIIVIIRITYGKEVNVIDIFFTSVPHTHI